MRFYNYGFKVYEKTLKHKFSNWNNLDDIYTEKEGKYVFLSDSKVGYFVSRLSYFRSYSLFAFSRGLPVTIFGKIRDENNEIKVVISGDAQTNYGRIIEVMAELKKAGFNKVGLKTQNLNNKDGK